MLNDGARAPPPRPDSGVHTVAIDSRATYTGSWRSGMRHGEGTMSWSSGQRCLPLVVCAVAGVVRVQVVGRTGGDKRSRGALNRWSGRRYEGEWQDDKMHGRGTQVFADGKRCAPV